jgi:hypothetical protein
MKNTKSRSENIKKKDYTIKMILIEIRCEGIGWIKLAQDRDKSWTTTKTVTKLKLHYKGGVGTS